MGSESQGSQPPVLPKGNCANLFALVIYVPGQLGEFLDDLRRELVPEYNPRAHVSVLPPRPLSVEWGIAGKEVEALAGRTKPFDIGLTGVEIFPATGVIYLEVGAGSTELQQLHTAICGGSLAFDEPFIYQPHMTLAQDFRRDDVAALHQIATRRWQEFSGARGFRAERAMFVHNRSGSCWEDLAEYSLGGTAPPRLPPNGRPKM